MRGFPKHFNTKQDVLNLLNTPEFAPQAKKALQSMIDNRFTWVVAKELSEKDVGIEDETHKVVIETQDGKQISNQVELKEDSQSHLFRLGFTVAEAMELMK